MTTDQEILLDASFPYLHYFSNLILKIIQVRIIEYFSIALCMA